MFMLQNQKEPQLYEVLSAKLKEDKLSWMPVKDSWTYFRSDEISCQTNHMEKASVKYRLYINCNSGDLCKLVELLAQKFTASDISKFSFKYMLSK